MKLRRTKVNVKVISLETTLETVLVAERTCSMKEFQIEGPATENALLIITERHPFRPASDHSLHFIQFIDFCIIRSKFYVRIGQRRGSIKNKSNRCHVFIKKYCEDNLLSWALIAD